MRSYSKRTTRGGLWPLQLGNSKRPGPLLPSSQLLLWVCQPIAEDCDLPIWIDFRGTADGARPDACQDLFLGRVCEEDLARGQIVATLLPPKRGLVRTSRVLGAVQSAVGPRKGRYGLAARIAGGGGKKRHKHGVGAPKAATWTRTRPVVTSLPQAKRGGSNKFGTTSRTQSTTARRGRVPLSGDHPCGAGARGSCRCIAVAPAATSAEDDGEGCGRRCRVSKCHAGPNSFAEELSVEQTLLVLTICCIEEAACVGHTQFRERTSPTCRLREETVGRCSIAPCDGGSLE